LADADQAFLLDVGVFNGSEDSTAVVTTDTDKDKDVVAKVFTQPFRALDFIPLRDFGFGVAASAGNRGAGTAVDGPNQFRPLGQGAGFYTVTPTASAEGGEFRIVPQSYLYWQGLSLLGEYVRESESLKGPSYTAPGKTEYNTVANEAYDVQLGWVLTGEDASWNGVKLNQNSHSFGALQWVGRYQGLNFDQESFSRYDNGGASASSVRFLDPRVSPSSLSSWGAVLNYTPVNDVKVTLDWEETHYTDGNKSGTGAGTVTSNRETEKVLFSRVQFAF
jgi:phosphate-selective porin OprO/OprP